MRLLRRRRGDRMNGGVVLADNLRHDSAGRLDVNHFRGLGRNDEIAHYEPLRSDRGIDWIRVEVGRSAEFNRVKGGSPAMLI